MNPWQLAQQIRHKLQAVTWPGVGGAVVFGDRGVRVCAGTPTDENVPPGFPWAMVLIGGAAADEDQPDLLLQDFTVAVAVNVGGDRYGEHALLGGSPASMMESGGRGLGEVMERARYAIQALSGADGVRIVVSATNTTGPTPLGAGKHLAMAELSFSALCTAQPYYAAPQRIRWTSGIWSWENDCAERYDFWRYRLVRKDGSTPSSSPSDGTTLHLSTVNGYTGAKTADKTYTVFAEYDSRGRGEVEGYSEAERGSFLVV